MSETETLRQIHAAIGSLPSVRLWRVNVGLAVPKRLLAGCPRCRNLPPVMYGLKGMADLLGIVGPSGRFLSVEVKSDTGKAREDQTHWADMVERFGGLAIREARSVEEVVEALNGQR